MEIRTSSGPNRRVTLRDVARECGVSIGTVSVVLNRSKSGSHISQTTRERIAGTAKAMGYRANRLARTLQSGSTRTIGIVPSSVEENLILGPHLQLVMNAAVNSFEAVHYDVLLLTRCDQSNSDELLDVIFDGRIDGAILVAPRSDSNLIPVLVREQFPFVVVDGSPLSEAHVFGIDNAMGVRQAVEHLAGLGHRRIAHIAGTRTLSAGRARREAFISEARKLGLDVPSFYIEPGSFSAVGGAAAMNRLLQLKPWPTAVFCGNDEMALGAMDAARTAGLSIPRDLSIVGYDDFYLAQHVQPKLTTVRNPVELVTKAAVQVLLELIGSRPVDPQPIFPCDLIIRESTAPPKEVPRP